MEETFIDIPDYHTHTRLCKHADGQVIDYARSAEERGLTEIACTEHSPAPEPFSTAVRMALDEFPLYRQWAEAAQQASHVNILFGLEADYYEDCEAFLEPWLEEQAFDYVLGSVHVLKYERERDHAMTGLIDVPADICWRVYMERMGQLARTGLYDAAAHFDLPKRVYPTPPVDQLAAWALPALDELAAAGMGLEINTSGLRHDCREPYPSLQILRWAHERDLPLTFGSDAHHPDHVGRGFTTAVAMAKEAGYSQRAIYRQRQRTLVPLS